MAAAAIADSASPMKVLCFRSGPLPYLRQPSRARLASMSGEARSGDGDSGAHKTAHRLPWLTGEYVAKQVLTLVMASVGALLGASWVISAQFTSINNKITANAAGVKSTKASVALLATDVDSLKADLANQTNVLRGVFSRQYGHLKDKVDERFDRLEVLTGRMDERVKQIQVEQLKEMRRAPSWRRDEWMQKKP